MTRNQYLASDLWDLKQYPHPYVREVFRLRISPAILDFSRIRSNTVKQQVKDYVQYTAEEYLPTLKQASHTYSQIWQRIHNGVRFLSETSIEYSDILLDHRQLQAAYIQYATEILGHTGTIGRNGSVYMTNNMIPNVYRYLETKKDLGKSIWDRDVIKLSDLHMAPERINPTSGSTSLRLDYYKDPEDRNSVILYFKYLISETQVSFSAIYGRNTEIKQYCLHLYKRGTTLVNATRSDVESYYAEYGAHVLKSTLDSRISTMFHLYEYLQAYSIVEANPFSMHDRSQDKYHYRLKTVEDSTVAQLFAVLDQIDSDISCMFLMMFCTGMRVSEVCQIRNDCMIHNEKGWFVVYYNQKMRKDVMNQIPEALAERLQREIDKRTKLP